MTTCAAPSGPDTVIARGSHRVHSCLQYTNENSGYSPREFRFLSPPQLASVNPPTRFAPCARQRHPVVNAHTLSPIHEERGATGHIKASVREP